MCSTTTGRSQSASRGDRLRQCVGVHHELEDQAAVLQRLEHRGPRDRLVAFAHDPDATKARGRDLLVELTFELRVVLVRIEATDEHVGVPGGVGLRVELARLVDQLRRRGCRHVHELLHVPLRRLREVDVLVEASTHAGDVAHVELLHAGEVRIPVGARRIPEMYVRVDDAFDRHASLLSLVARTITRRVPSTHGGNSGPPNEIEPSGCGWLRSPIQSAVATSSAPESPDASSALTR